MGIVHLSSDHEYQSWTVSAVCLLLATISALGAVGNVINIKTFLRLGISDGVNMSLISLATSDLLYLISAFFNSICLMLHGVEELSSYKIWFPVDPKAVLMVFTNIGSGFYAISMLVTTFITVVRCLAVANPLKYRNLISWRSTAIIILIFIVLSETSAILEVVFLGIVPQFDPNINTTRLVLWSYPEHALLKDYTYGIRDVFLPFASQIIVGICVVIIYRYIKESSRFRLSLSKNTCANDIPTIMDNERNNKGTSNESGSPRLVGRELQVVRQMLLIAIVYSVCNMPKVVFNVTHLILPDFESNERYVMVYLTSNIIRELIQTTNASVTIFIYWKYNSKFKAHFFG